jgi:hypothetical protein
MTLADFARSIGISPATARQWKKRGKIVEVEGGFELIAEAQREWLGIAGRDVSVTVDNRTAMGVIGNLVNPEVVTVASQWEDVTQPESVTTVASTVDSAQDSHGSEGADMPPESNRESCAGYDRDTISRADIHDRRTKTEIALEARIEILEAPSTPGFCRGCESLLQETAAQRILAMDCNNRIVDLQSDIERLRDRVTALEGDSVARSRAEFYKADAELGRAIEDLGKPQNGVIDPPGPNWGA